MKYLLAYDRMALPVKWIPFCFSITVIYIPYAAILIQDNLDIVMLFLSLEVLRDKKMLKMFQLPSLAKYIFIPTPSCNTMMTFYIYIFTIYVLSYGLICNPLLIAFVCLT